MSQGPDHERFATSLASFLLGALPEEEREELEAHFAQCSVCRGDVERLAVAVDALPASAPPVEPPPELKARIMSVVEADAALLSAAGARADRPEPAPARRRRWSLGLGAGRLRPALAALAAVALLLVGGVGGALLARGGEPSVKTIAARVDPRVAPGAAASLRVVGEQATLVARDLPAPRRGRLYQVWLIRRGSSTPVPASAVFVPRTDGSATVGVGSVANVQQVLVSSEPGPGAQSPSTPPFVAVSTA